MDAITDQKPSKRRRSGTDYSTLRELAERTGLDYRSVHRAAVANKFRTVRFGGCVLVPRKEIERVIRQGWTVVENSSQNGGKSSV